MQKIAPLTFIQITDKNGGTANYKTQLTHQNMLMNMRNTNF